MYDKIYIGNKVSDLVTQTAYLPVSKVIIWVEDNKGYESGDDTGRTFELDCPWGTQEMADDLLAKLKGFTYKPYEAKEASLDPAFELGDIVTIGNFSSMIADVTIRSNGLSDMTAEGEDEINHEYPYQSSNTRKFNREILTTRSSIAKTEEEIKLQIEGITGDISSITQTVDAIELAVQDANSNVSRIEQYVDSITLTVQNGSTSSSIQLKAGDTVISSQNITFNGFVTFTGLASGTTTIDGACIKTGTISAKRLNLSGAISFDDFDDETYTAINDAVSTADRAYDKARDAENQISGWTYGSTTYIDGRMIKTGTVMASELLGGSVGLLTSDERTAGYIDVSGASTASYKINIISRGALELNANVGDVFIEDGYGEYLHLMTGTNRCVIGKCDLTSSENGVYSCGDSSHKWSALYASSSTIVTSDAKYKKDVNYNLDAYNSFFDNLSPCSYAFTDGSSGRTHIGMIAQDVERELLSAGFSTQQFAGFVKDRDEDGSDFYALRYEEFIALCIDQIQKLKARVRKLEVANG